MLKQIQAEASPFDLKKHEGGIIEIEFALRLLQIQHGATNPALWRGDVYGALAALEEAQLLPPEHAKVLLDAYTLYRRVENRIRMAHGRAGTKLPESPEAQADLTRRLGLSDDLFGLITHHRDAVHGIYTEVLGCLKNDC